MQRRRLVAATASHRVTKMHVQFYQGTSACQSFTNILISVIFSVEIDSPSELRFCRGILVKSPDLNQNTFGQNPQPQNLK